MHGGSEIEKEVVAAHLWRMNFTSLICEKLRYFLKVVPRGLATRSTGAAKKLVALSTRGCTCFCTTEHESAALHARGTHGALPMRTVRCIRALQTILLAHPCLYNCVNAVFTSSHIVCLDKARAHVSRAQSSMEIYASFSKKRKSVFL